MKWSWKLGKVFGINVYMHATFLILIAWIVLTEWGETHSGRAVAGSGVVHSGAFCLRCCA